jgi:hypothetical protein
LDLLIAMVEYLKSGESKSGNLNNSVPTTLHKDYEVKSEEDLTVELGSGDIGGEEALEVAEGVAEGVAIDGDPAVGVPRKRKAESSENAGSMG